MRRVIAFTGPSNSGKTTLIEKIALTLNDKKVAIIKHDPKDKAVFDKDGKDSHKFFQTGADVAVVSPKRATLFFNGDYAIDKIIEKFDDFDILMIEGLKHLKFPRIGVFRNKIDEEYLNVVKAIAIDNSIDIKDYNISKNIDILDLNSVDEVIEWIYKNAKILKD